MSPTFLPSAAATQVNHSCLVLSLAQPDPLHGFQPGLYYGEDHSISQKCAFLSMFKLQTVDAFASRDTTVWLILWGKKGSLWWRIALAASRKFSGATRSSNQEAFKRIYCPRPRLLLSDTGTMHNPPRISIMATSSSINGQRSPEILFKVLGAGSHLPSDITSHRVPCTKLVSCHLVK
jgi:hypothetical protein